MYINASLSHVLLHEQENLSQSALATNTSHVLITPPPSEEDLLRIEETKRAAPQDIVQFQGIEIDLSETVHDQDNNDERTDIHALTPREMVDFSLDLYIDGALSFDEYSMMAFQPELHPAFDKTIGALTGDRAEPDRPRDLINEWQERYQFEKRYPGANENTLQKIERILGVLGALDQPLTDLSA